MSYPKQPIFINHQSAESVVRSPLLQTIDQNNIGACEELILSNANQVYEVGWNNLTPLHQVCIRGQIEILHLLLQHGAKVDARSTFGESPLHYACRRGDVRIMHLLIKAGADVAASDKKGRGCAHFTALGGNIPAMHYLGTQTELSFDDKDELGETPLHIACVHRHFALVDYLLRKDRSKVQHQSVKGQTILHLAAQIGNIEMVWKVLSISSCSLVHVSDGEGKTALDIAKKEATPRHHEVAETLKYYAKQPRDSRPTGPTLTWWFLLLLPFTYAASVLLIADYFDSYAGLLALALSVLLVVIVSRQSHRIHHPCRWPNPIFLGSFAAGIIHCLLVGYFKLVNELWPCYDLLIGMLGCGGVALWYMFHLVRGDPGCISRSRHENGQPMTVLDIALGRCKETDFCPYTEIIRPSHAKYCKLCERLVLGLDHHCLFLMNCVARLNHKDFVIFIFDVMILQVIFVFKSWRFMNSFYPNNVVEFVVPLMFRYEPKLLVLCLLCVLAFVWESTLMFEQCRNISRGQTTYYAGPRTPLTFREGATNLIRFICSSKRRPLDVESALKPL